MSQPTDIPGRRRSSDSARTGSFSLGGIVSASLSSSVASSSSQRERATTASKRRGSDERGGGDDDDGASLTPRGLLDAAVVGDGDEACYELAVKNGWVVCIPQQISLRGVDTSSQNFVESHILRPWEQPADADADADADEYESEASFLTLNGRFVRLTNEVLYVHDGATAAHPLYCHARVLREETHFDDQYRSLCVVTLQYPIHLQTYVDAADPQPRHQSNLARWFRSTTNLVRWGSGSLASVGPHGSYASSSSPLQGSDGDVDLLGGLSLEVGASSSSVSVSKKARTPTKQLPICAVPLKTGSFDEANNFLRSFRCNLNTLRRIDHWACLFADTLMREGRSPRLSLRIVDKIRSRLVVVTKGAVSLLLSANPIFSNSHKFSPNFKSDLHQSIENYMIASLSQPILFILARLHAATDREIDVTLGHLQQHPFVEELGLLDQYDGVRTVQQLVKIEAFMKAKLRDAVSEMSIVPLCKTPMQILLRLKNVADSVSDAIVDIRRQLPAYLAPERLSSPFFASSSSTSPSHATDSPSSSSFVWSPVVPSPSPSPSPSPLQSPQSAAPSPLQVDDEPTALQRHAPAVVASPQPIATAAVDFGQASISPRTPKSTPSVNEEVTTDDLLSYMIAVLAWSKPANCASMLAFIGLHVAKSFNASSELGFLHTTFEGTLSFLAEQQEALRHGRRITPTTPTTTPTTGAAFASRSGADDTPGDGDGEQQQLSSSLSSSLAQFGLLDAVSSPREHSDHSGSGGGGDAMANQVLVWGCAPEPVATPHLVSSFDSGESVVATRCAEKATFVLMASGELYISDVYQNIGAAAFLRQEPALAGIRIRLVAGGDAHVICVSSDHRGFVWGQNDYGQLGLGDTTSHSTPQFNPLMSSMIQRSDPANLVRALACGDAFSALLSTSGQVWTWGKGEYGSLGLGEDDNHNRAVPFQVNGLLARQVVVQIACGSRHTLCLTDTGQLYAFGCNAKGQLGVNGDRASAAASSAMEPTLVSYFDQRFVKMISAGFASSAALVDNSVYMWGAGDKGQLGNGSLVDQFLPTELAIPDSHGERPVAVSCGAAHSALVTDAGTVYTWGANRFGQLGTGDFKDYPTPQRLKLLQAFQIESLACGFWQTVAFGNKRWPV